MSSESTDLRTEQCWLIQYRVCRGLISKQKCDEMKGLYRTDFMPKRTIQGWHKEFYNGCTSVTSLLENGQP